MLSTITHHLYVSLSYVPQRIVSCPWFDINNYKLLLSHCPLIIMHFSLVFSLSLLCFCKFSALSSIPASIILLQSPFNSYLHIPMIMLIFCQISISITTLSKFRHVSLLISKSGHVIFIIQSASCRQREWMWCGERLLVLKGNYGCYVPSYLFCR